MSLLSSVHFVICARFALVQLNILQRTEKIRSPYSTDSAKVFIQNSIDLYLESRVPVLAVFVFSALSPIVCVVVELQALRVIPRHHVQHHRDDDEAEHEPYHGRPQLFGVVHQTVSRLSAFLAPEDRYFYQRAELPLING